MNVQAEQNYWATCKSNEKFLIIQTRSGLGITLIDHIYPPFIFNHTEDNKGLGMALLQALANSRTFIYGSPEEEDFFDTEKSQNRYNDWIEDLCKSHGCKTKKTLLKNMKSCSVWLKNGQIEISPSKHVKLEAWESISGEDVFLTLDNSPEEIGAGLRLALSRCR